MTRVVVFGYHEVGARCLRVLLDARRSLGLEIPLVMRILKRHFQARYGLKDLVSQVLTFDYLGALVVALAFPLLLVPHLGLIRTGFFFGLLNAGVAVVADFLEGLHDSHTFLFPPLRPYKVDYGVRYRSVGEGVFIWAVTPGSDAERKVAPGDRVLAVNGTTAL